jgi:1-acyl-sn-glycerol-3-phosphate acyltransferase
MLGRMQVEGRANIPRSGPIILTPNHISDCDPPAVGAALLRPVYFMAKAELFSIPILAPIIRRFHAFPVKRNEADRAALRRAEELLRAGQVLVIFPEGQLSPTGTLQEMMSGGALLALRTGAPIVPVYLEGTNRIIPYGKIIPRWSCRRVVVRFGKPFYLKDLEESQDRRQALEEGTARIRDAIVALAADGRHSRGGSGGD